MMSSYYPKVTHVHWQKPEPAVPREHKNSSIVKLV